LKETSVKMEETVSVIAFLAIRGRYSTLVHLILLPVPLRRTRRFGLIPRCSASEI